MPLPHIASPCSSLAASSRASTSEPREVTVHITTISTVGKGNHAPLSRQDESQANPGDAAPQTKNTSGGRRRNACCWVIEPNVLLCACIHTPHNRVRFPTSPSPDVEIRTDDSQVCVSLCPFCVYSYTILQDQTLHGIPPRVPHPFTSHVQDTAPLFLPSHSESSSASAAESGSQTHSTSSPSHPSSDSP